MRPLCCSVFPHGLNFAASFERLPQIYASVKFAEIYAEFLVK
ncbi:hypothetical protein [uncultured Campylobacter sp.]|nr:hypothetical protein [uncultured Campylobacter sp.]